VIYSLAQWTCGFERRRSVNILVCDFVCILSNCRKAGPGILFLVRADLGKRAAQQRALAIRPHHLFALSWPIHSAEFIAQPPADF
jgi:hypothetical protein